MRSCPTLNNNITNNFKTKLTMTEDALNATDHDDDSKRIVSSYNYDLPDQEQDDDDVFKWEDQDDASNAIDDVFKWEDQDDASNAINQDGDNNGRDMGNASFVSPDILTAVDACTRLFEGWEDEMNTSYDGCCNIISNIAPSYLNAINGLITYINEDYAIYFNEWDNDLPNQANNSNGHSYLPDMLLMAFQNIKDILDDVTRYMNQELMNEEEIKPIRNRERRRRAEYEKLYQWKAERQRTTMMSRGIKLKVGISTLLFSVTH
jgi:hypothetical protein